MPWQDAYFHVEEKSPGVDATAVLEMLKKQDRVKYNETNQVFMYEVGYSTGFAPTDTSLRSCYARNRTCGGISVCTRAQQPA